MDTDKATREDPEVLKSSEEKLLIQFVKMAMEFAGRDLVLKILNKDPSVPEVHGTIDLLEKSPEVRSEVMKIFKELPEEEEGVEVEKEIYEKIREEMRERINEQRKSKYCPNYWLCGNRNLQMNCEVCYFCDNFLGNYNTSTTKQTKILKVLDIDCSDEPEVMCLVCKEKGKKRVVRLCGCLVCEDCIKEQYNVFRKRPDGITSEQRDKMRECPVCGKF
jgi:hypothetical protein